MSDRFSDSEASREALSALADGEAQSSEVARACAAWKDQPDARATWHAYQMIGDVMRSDDLAQAGEGSAFLKNFRERLAQEPVVLAPSAAAAQRPMPVSQPVPVAAPLLRRRTWAGPMAVAAGFVMVVGALMTSQFVPGDAPVGGVPMAQSNNGFGGDLSLSVAPAPMGNGGFISVADAVKAQGMSEGPSFNRPDGAAVLIRDPKLDQVLAAQHAASNADGTFAGQRALARQVVFDAQ
ncbi:MAG: sigma-E factor negative regulatory protein [Aquabacterium sp.]